jgi:hypothetical protein
MDVPAGKFSFHDNLVLSAIYMQIFPLVSVIAPVSSVYYAAKKFLAGRVTKQWQEPSPSPPIELDNK